MILALYMIIALVYSMIYYDISWPAMFLLPLYVFAEVRYFKLKDRISDLEKFVEKEKEKQNDQT